MNPIPLFTIGFTKKSAEFFFKKAFSANLCALRGSAVRFCF